MGESFDLSPMQAQTLFTLNAKLKSLAQELDCLKVAGQAYAASLGLDPSKNYSLVPQDDGSFSVLELINPEKAEE